MSLSVDERDADSKSKIPLFTRDNWTKWEQLIKDYILALDHDEAADIWTAYKWVPADGGDDPADRDYQAAANAADRKLRVKHNNAFKYIRAHLSPAVFDTTMHLPTSVPMLLRHLRRYWNDGSVCDRDKLRTEYQDMRLQQYADMEKFVTAFTNMVRVMRNHNLGLVSNDDDVLYQFNKSLPRAWELHKSIVEAMPGAPSFETATAYYIKKARDDPSLPGSLAKSAKLKQRDAVHFGAEQTSRPMQQPQKTEVCR